MPDWPYIYLRIYGLPMTDRNVYQLKIITNNLVTDYIYYWDTISYLSREFLWNYIISYMYKDIGLSIETIFFSITLFVLWRIAVDITSRIGIYYIIFIFNPLIVDYAFSQMRLALAIAILSFFWRGQRGRAVTVIAYAVCTSIHTAVSLFAVMHFVSNRFVAPKRTNLLVLCITGLLIAAAIGPLREAILGAIGDRRAEYSDMSSSMLYLSFWVVMLGALLFNWKDTMNSVDGRYSIIILSIVVMNLITGGYSTRFIAAAFPSLLIAMCNSQKNWIIPIFTLYAIAQWMYWFKLI